ncbi:MAG: sugar nucleotide-binding protein, partial [Candidatus Magasanikbacteria bacterium]|nr:sugar nucleotide-binding protein [Candidatus Magasanikbacteria bacterium]
MKIVVVGAAGMLGQELITEGTRLGHEMVALDRDQIDVAAPESDEAIAAYDPQVIINAIGYNAVDDAETSAGFALAQLLNAEIPER